MEVGERAQWAEIRSCFDRACFDGRNQDLSEVPEQGHVDLIEPSWVEVSSEVFEVVLLDGLQCWHAHPTFLLNPGLSCTKPDIELRLPTGLARDWTA